MACLNAQFRFILSVGVLIISGNDVAVFWAVSLRLMARKYTSSHQPNSTGHSTGQ